MKHGYLTADSLLGDVGFENSRISFLWIAIVQDLWRERERVRERERERESVLCALCVCKGGRYIDRAKECTCVRE